MKDKTITWITKAGLVGEVWQGPFWICGYVHIPIFNQLYGKHYTDQDFPEFEVIGDVSLADTSSYDGIYRIGFDTAHRRGTPEQRTVEGVKAEVEKLALQIASYQ